MIMIKQFLQGKWLSHPLHPALVHIPVSLWIASFVADVLLLIGIGGEAMAQLARYALALGLLVALLAIPAGIADWVDIKREKPAWKLGLFHMLLNLSAGLLFAISLGVRLANGTVN